MRTPVRHCGLGLRSMEDVRLTGFMGGLEQALTGVVGEEPLVPQLAGILGTVEGMQRWQDLLRSGSRTGRELTILWQILLEEARQSSYYLEEDMVQGPPEQPVEGAGEECTTGEKRHLLTTYLEDQRLKVLKHALEIHPDSPSCMGTSST